MTKLKEFDVADFLDDDATRQEYLKQILEDGNPDEIAKAFLDVARSYGSENISKKTNLDPDKFYDLFKPKSHFDDLLKVIKAFNLKIACA